MGCGISRPNEEYDVKDIRSFSSRDSCKSISQLPFRNVALSNLVLKSLTVIAITTTTKMAAESTNVIQITERKKRLEAKVEATYPTSGKQM
jgi:hypothetical protein